MVALNTFSMAIVHYEILKQTPLNQTVRVWCTPYGTKNDVYNGTFTKDGIYFIYDLIIENGKYGVTIIPHGKYHTKYGINLLSSIFGGASYNMAIYDYNTFKSGDVSGKVSKTDTTAFPVMYMFSKLDNIITGLGSNRVNTLVMENDTDNTFISYIGFEDIDDDFKNNLQIFSAFSKAYYYTNGNPMKFWISAGDSGWVGGSVTSDTSVIDDEFRVVPSSAGSMYIDLSNLPKGSYRISARMKSMTSNALCKFKVLRNGTTTIESYQMNISYAADNFYNYSTWDFRSLSFTVDDESDFYRIEITNVTSGYDNAVDGIVIIPLSNGKDFPHDLYEQQMSINNNIYIGML